MSTAGPKSPTAFATDNSVGATGWSNLSNVAALDGSYTTCTTPSSTVSQYLVVTNFKLPVPGSATIQGILVEIARARSGGGAPSVSDNLVRLVKGGVIASGDKSVVGNWPTTVAYASYGGSSDLWGLTWTGLDINPSGFGVALSASLHASTGSVTAQVDHIRVTVTYTYGGNTKSVSAHISTAVRRTRGVGKIRKAAVALHTSNLRGSVHQLVSHVGLSVTVVKGLSLSFKNRVKTQATISTLRASAVRFPLHRFKMWVWVEEHIEEDDWIR